MTPTQEQIRKLSDEELDVQQKIVQSLRRRVQLREKWIAAEIKRRNKDETSRQRTRRARRQVQSASGGQKAIKGKTVTRVLVCDRTV